MHNTFIINRWYSKCFASEHRFYIGVVTHVCPCWIWHCVQCSLSHPFFYLILVFENEGMSSNMPCYHLSDLASWIVGDWSHGLDANNKRCEKHFNSVLKVDKHMFFTVTMYDYFLGYILLFAYSVSSIVFPAVRIDLQLQYIFGSWPISWEPLL